MVLKGKGSPSSDLATSNVPPPHTHTVTLTVTEAGESLCMEAEPRSLRLLLKFWPF